MRGRNGTLTLRAALAVLLLAGLASTGQAGEVLKLKSGELIPGEVVSIDDANVTFAPAKGGSLQVPWTKVHPINRYELWKSTLASDDAEGRVGLARWALSADLFLYARREVVESRGLGFEDTQALDQLLASIHRREADLALEDVDALLEEGRFKEALARITKYVRGAADKEQSDRVRARVPDIVQRIERQDQLDRENERKDAETAKQKRKQAWVKKNLTRATDGKAGATADAIEGYRYLEKGNQTLTRRHLAKAEKGYQDARALFRRVRKEIPTGEFAALCKREMDDCDRRTVGVLQRWGALEVGNKSWKKASAIVDRGLKVDPVDRELLDLRKVIDENWIRRRVSGVTGARPR